MTYTDSYNKEFVSNDDYISKVNSHKCDKVSIGYSSDACSNLICMKCDIQVKVFRNLAWNKENSNYLFFRSYYDDINMLKSNLIPSKGSTSYSCQCFWIVSNDSKEDLSDSRWFCNDR